MSDDPKPVPDVPNPPPPPAAGGSAAGGADAFAQDIEDLLRETPEVAPAPEIWTRIEAELQHRPTPAPRKPGDPAQR